MLCILYIYVYWMRECVHQRRLVFDKNVRGTAFFSLDVVVVVAALDAYLNAYMHKSRIRMELYIK